MKALLQDIKTVREEYPYAAEVYLAVLYESRVTGHADIKRMERVLGLQPRTLERTLMMLAANGLVKRLDAEAGHYAATELDDFFSLRGSAASRTDVLRILREMFPNNEEFEREIVCFERLLKRDRNSGKRHLTSFKKVVAFLQSCQKAGVRGFGKMTDEELDKHLTVSSDESPAKKAARIVYRRIEQSRVKSHLLEHGVPEKFIREAIVTPENENADEFFKQVVAELVSLRPNLKVRHNGEEGKQ